jgi:hypothetical protein
MQEGREMCKVRTIDVERMSRLDNLAAKSEKKTSWKTWD